MKRNHSSYPSLRIGRLLILGLLAMFASSCAVKSPGAKGSKATRVLLVGGGSSHNFDLWYKGADATTLRQAGYLVTYTANTDSIAEYLKSTDVLYLSNNQAIKSQASRQAILDHIAAGKGLLLAHAALWYNWKDWPEYNKQIAAGGSNGHDRYGSFDVNFTNTTHPVTQGQAAKLTLKDERYYYIPDPAGPGIEVLASNSVAGSEKTFPSIFVVKNDKARIVGIALGHDAESHNIPQYQAILRNAVKWVSKK
ncbi:ThuA domain-containing protein [Hufsiella ginkgonis]|uniref:ThuA domain-containing protein n=1 Tax=Hufsiella ginkgonis TaxID=2695274 RepID=A0A7K1XZD5_9SPHI|nr:ThuA domain-containing protein [Hufsiella ginkgonis]MXV16371.1 ThuA domain-containing protein [Hufsiella ginkgonis]